jgi:hypothetical protein
MRRRTLWTLLVVCVASLGSTSNDEAVNAANLLDHERLWPYRVALTESWKPPGREEPIAAGAVGILIRVEPGELARVDFSREGKYEVPVAKTDLVANANRIRRGELAKQTPNFIEAIGPRVIDPTVDPVTTIRPEKIADQRRFLCVFADANAKDFAKLAAALRPLMLRSDVATVLFPQGRQSNQDVLKRLKENDWIVPFVFEHLSEPYTSTLLRENTPMPNLMLVSEEGRVLFQSVWQSDATARLQAALDTGSSDR